MICAEWDEIVKNTCIHDGYVLKNTIIFASIIYSSIFYRIRTFNMCIPSVKYASVVIENLQEERL